MIGDEGPGQNKDGRGLSDAEPDAAVLPYRLRWRPRGEKPGAHPARAEGGEGSFRGLLPLLARPDPRRIDLRATLRDPFDAVHVRSFAPRRAITVAALVDLSGSMGFDEAMPGHGPPEVARFAATLAASAAAGGDAFTLLAADDAPREDIRIAPTHRRGIAQEVLSRLAHAPASRRSARGLLAAAEDLPRRRCLVFLVSDFLIPAADLADLLDALWRHDVVPVVVRDSRTEGHVPAYGLMEAQDAETGARRLVVMRPSLRARWRAQAHARLEALDAAFTARGRHAFHLVDRFDPDALHDFLARR